MSNATAEFQQIIQQTPKADLHVHLEGTVGCETLNKLAARNAVALDAPTVLAGGKLTFPAPDLSRGYAEFGNFLDFISLYVKVSDCIRSAEDIRDVAADYLKQAAAENIRALEIYFSPTTYLLFGRALEPLMEGLVEAQRLAVTANIKLSWIFDIVRNTVTDGMPLIEIALAARKRGVNVEFIGLAGDESEGHAKNFAAAFQRARAENFRVLAHAGETVGPQSIRDVLEHLQPERIGHGVRVIEDEGLMCELRDRQIPLEVCPWSNVELQVFKQDKHPIADLQRFGLNVILASDDPGLFRKTLTDNFLLAHELGLSADELITIANRSLNLSK